jgi:thioredoxin 1
MTTPRTGGMVQPYRFDRNRRTAEQSIQRIRMEEKMETKVLVGHADDNTFESDVLKTDRPALVDFWAPWCGPCRALAPVLEEIGKEYDGRLNVIKVNVDESPKTAASYGVRSIPTLLFLQAEKVRETIVGLTTKDKLAAFIDRNLPG